MKKFEIKICKKFEVVANSRENALEKLTHDFSLEKLDKNEARKDAEEYIKTGLLEEYNERDRNKFRIEIVSYNKN